MWRGSRSVVALAVAASLLSACTERAPDPDQDQEPSPTRPTVTTSPVDPGVAGSVDEVTVEGIGDHLEALQVIADEHGGTRAVGTEGYEASVDYVAGVLVEAGYDVQTPTTEVPVFEQLEPSTLVQLLPSSVEWVDGEDFRAMLFSGSGDVEGRLGDAGTGCTSAEFDGFAAGEVALVHPGPCFRRDQVVNAQAAGAAAVVSVSTALAGHPLRPTLLFPDGIDVPALSVTQAAGRALVPGTTVRIHVRATSSSAMVESVIGNLPAGPGEEEVVMLGGHLDSAIDGPGLNDNGSGVATLLELARWLGGGDPAPSVRVAFWGGEEVGLYGSRDYVGSLSGEERDEIALYLNLDMLGSPNFVTYVYAPSDAGLSREVADLFVDALAGQGLGSELLDLGGASDHGPFEEAGIPTGGLYSGSLERKTSEQAALYGGIAGEPLDPCYHQPCDTIDNVDRTAIGRHADALVEVLTILVR